MQRQATQQTIGAHCARITGSLPVRQHPVLLCLGSAPGGVLQATVFLSHTAADVAACNDAITTYPHALHLAASLHPERLEGWVQHRGDRAVRPCVVGPEQARGVDVVVSLGQACGSSAMYLAFLGQLMGYERIVLAGITLERPGEEPYRELWRGAKTTGALVGVESLSPGWLAQALKGRPE